MSNTTTINLIGRDEQFKKLDQLLQKALEGKMQVALLSGESGVGKTALMQAFVQRVQASHNNIVAAGSHCEDIAGGQQEPYLPYSQILEQIAQNKQSSRFLTTVRHAISELAPDWLQIVPVAGGWMAAIVKTAQWGWKEAGLQNFDQSQRMVQYVRVMIKVSETIPLVLWIDDLQWADRATLSLTSFLTDEAAKAHILLVIAYRPMDIAGLVNGSQYHPVRQLFAKLKRSKQCVEIQISNFNLEDLDHYLESRQYRFPSEFFKHLYQQSGGNPLFIQEYLVLLHSRHQLHRSVGYHSLAKAQDIPEIPKTLCNVIEQRLDLVDKELFDLLISASIQGQRFSVALLAACLGKKVAEILNQLNFLENRYGLVQELQEESGELPLPPFYQFMHGAIQQVVYQGLSDSQRVHLHHEIAKQITNLLGADTSKFSHELAQHYEKGGQILPACQHHLQAGRNALQVQAWDDALNHGQSIIRLTKTLEQNTDHKNWIIRGYLIIIEAKLWKSNYDDALEICDQAEKLCDIEEQSDLYALILYWRARILTWQGREDLAFRPTKQALDILSKTNRDIELKGELYSRLMWLQRQTHIEQLQRALNDAMVFAQAQKLDRLEADMLRQSAWVALNRNDNPVQALDYAQRALVQAVNKSMRYEEITCRQYIAQSLISLRLYHEALLELEHAKQLAIQRKLTLSVHLVLCRMAIAYVLADENWQKGWETLQSAVNIADQNHFPVCYHGIEIGCFLAISLGKWSEAESMAKRTLQQTPRGQAFYYFRMAELEFARQHYSSTINFCQESLRRFKSIDPDDRSTSRVKPLLGIALVEMGKPIEAQSVLEEALAYWQGRSDCRQASCYIGLGRAKLLSSDGFDQALDHFQKALTLAENDLDLDHPWSAWPIIYMDLAHVYWKIGDISKAQESARFGVDKFTVWEHFLLEQAQTVLMQVSRKV